MKPIDIIREGDDIFVTAEEYMFDRKPVSHGNFDYHL